MVAKATQEEKIVLSKNMKKLFIIIISFLILAASVTGVYLYMYLTPPKFNLLKYEQAPLENPLRGLFYNYKTAHPQSLTYTSEWLDRQYDNSGNIDFHSLENALNMIAMTGNQAIVRIVCNDPGTQSENTTDLHIPQYIYENLNERSRIFSEINAYGKKSEVPDYGDDFFLEELIKFIRAFGEKYDGDSRIGFIELGLLGHSGEWTYYPFHEQMTLSTEKINRIYEAFDTSFDTTKLLARNPIAGDAKNYNIGFHDDNYLHNTVSLEPVDPENLGHLPQFQYFMEVTKTYDKWKTEAYGGELSGATKHQFYKELGNDYFKKSIEVFHFSFLSLPLPDINSGDYQVALEETRKIGYELFINKSRVYSRFSKLVIDFSIKNTGFAPFYYDWDFKLQLKSESKTYSYILSDFKVSDILPGSEKNFTLQLERDIEKGEYTAALMLVNPLSEISDKYTPFAFANADRLNSEFARIGNYIEE